MIGDRPPTFETLIDGPPDAHKLIALIDRLAFNLYVIQILSEDTIKMDVSYWDVLYKINCLSKAALDVTKR